MTNQPFVQSIPAPPEHRPLRDDVLAAQQHHLFVVRMWWEPDNGNTPGEWRGSVEHVASRTKRYFRDLEALPDLVATVMGDVSGIGSLRALPPTDGSE